MTCIFRPPGITTLFETFPPIPELVFLKNLKKKKNEQITKLVTYTAAFLSVRIRNEKKNNEKTKVKPSIGAQMYYF